MGAVKKGVSSTPIPTSRALWLLAMASASFSASTLEGDASTATTMLLSMTRAFSGRPAPL